MGEGSVSASGQLQRGGFSFQRRLWAPLIPIDAPPWLALPMKQNKAFGHGGSSQRSLSQGEGKVTKLLEPPISSPQTL